MEAKETQRLPRNSNIELLRIIAMLFIIAGHMWGQGLKASSESQLNTLCGWILGSGSRFGVNVFLFIACWFMVDLKNNVGGYSPS